MKVAAALGFLAATIVASGCLTTGKPKVDTEPQGARKERKDTQKSSKDTKQTPPVIIQPLVARFSEACLVPEAEVKGEILQQAALLPTLAAVLIPKAVGVAVDFVGGLLQKAGEDKKTIFQAGAGPYLYGVSAWTPTETDPKVGTREFQLLPRARCLHLLSFRNSRNEKWATLVEGTQRTSAGIELVQTSLGMSKLPAPSFYLEYAVVVSADGASFKLVPTFLRYGASFSGASRDSELLSAISFSRPGAEKPFASTAILLRGLAVGQTYDFEQLLGSWSDWMPLDKPSEHASEARAKPHVEGIAEDDMFFDPVNVKTVMTETQDGIKILKALGELISGAKEDVTKAVGAAVPSDEKKAAAEASRLDDRNAYLSAMAAVTVKEAESASKTDAVEKAKAEAEVIKAKLEANKAALKASLPLPYGELYATTTQ